MRRQNRAMKPLPQILRYSFGFCLLVLCGIGASFAQAANEIPLQVEIRTQLDFSKAAAGGASGGRISIDPNNGSRQVDGGIIDLGGSALAGSAVITGEPGRFIRVDLPLSIRMSGNHGGAIEIRNLRTNLPPNARLDGFGKLEFSFGGDLEVKGSVAGTFRGRIPITAEYE